MRLRFISSGATNEHPISALKSFIRSAQQATFHSSSVVVGYFWRQEGSNTTRSSEREVFSGENLKDDWNKWLDQIMAERVNGAPYEIGFGYLTFKSPEEASSWNPNNPIFAAINFDEVSVALQELYQVEA